MSGALREILAKFSIEVDTKPLQQGAAAVGQMEKQLEKTDETAKKTSKSVAKSGENFEKFAKAVALAVATGAVKDTFLEIVDLGGALDDASQRLGIGVEDLQRWQFAAQLSGVSAEELNGSLIKFQKNLSEAADGSATAVDAMKKLGVDVKDSAGNIRPTTEVLREVAKGIAGIENPAKRNAALMDAFGKSGANLGPLFSKGAEGIDELLQELDKAGGGLTKDTVTALADMGDELDRFEMSTKSLKAQMVMAFLPTISKAVETFRGFASSIAQDPEAVEHLKNALVVLGAVGFAAGVQMILPYAGLALAIAAAILVYDDLMTAFQGGDSLTTRLLDKLFGKGAGKSIFKDLKKDWDEFKASVQEFGFLGALWEGFQNLGANITKFFVEDIPAAIDQAQTSVMEGTGGIGEKIVSGMVAGMKGALLGALDVISPETAKFGKAIIDGVVQGITDNLPALGGAVGVVVSTVKDKLNTGMEVHSPSKWTERFAGHVFSPLVTEAPGWAAKASAAGASVATATQFGLARGLTQSNTINIQANGRPIGDVRKMTKDAIDDLGTSALDYLEATA